jgi:hypothetical protein
MHYSLVYVMHVMLYCGMRYYERRRRSVSGLSSKRNIRKMR